MAKGAQVLIYNIDTDSPHGLKLVNAVHICGAAVKNVSADDSAQTIGYLLSLDGYNENPVTDSTDDRAALVFYNLDRQSLDRLLGLLRRAGIIIPLKAVVTEHNIGWTMSKLLDELENEHNLMKSWQKLNDRVKKYKGKDRELVKEAKALLSAHAPDTAAIEEMIKEFEK